MTPLQRSELLDYYEAQLKRRAVENEYGHVINDESGARIACKYWLWDKHAIDIGADDVFRYVQDERRHRNSGYNLIDRPSGH